MKKLSRDVISQLRSDLAINSVTQCVTELLHNSIDSKSTNVAIRVNLLELSRIQVVDNGFGMSKDELGMVASRYTTSKCSCHDDIDGFNCYGYRGEALTSIREVSGYLDITSRKRLTTSTYNVGFCQGKRGTVIPADHRPSCGTTVTVRDLFFNRPVRHKAVNSALVLDNICEAVRSIALINPSVSVTLRDDATGNMLIQTRKTPSTKSRFLEMFPAVQSADLMDLDFEESGFHIRGFVGKSLHCSKRLQFVYVNGRNIIKSCIHKYVTSLLMKPRYIKCTNECQTNSAYDKATYNLQEHSVFLLTITCLQNCYDITFNPRKSIIEFRDWNAVKCAIAHAICELSAYKDFQLDIDITNDNLQKKETLDDNENCRNGNNPEIMDNVANSIKSKMITRDAVPASETHDSTGYGDIKQYSDDRLTDEVGTSGIDGVHCHLHDSLFLEVINLGTTINVSEDDRDANGDSNVVNQVDDNLSNADFIYSKDSQSQDNGSTSRTNMDPTMVRGNLSKYRSGMSVDGNDPLDRININLFRSNVSSDILTEFFYGDLPANRTLTKFRKKLRAGYKTNDPHRSGNVDLGQDAITIDPQNTHKPSLGEQKTQQIHSGMCDSALEPLPTPVSWSHPVVLSDVPIQCDTPEDLLSIQNQNNLGGCIVKRTDKSMKEKILHKEERRETLPADNDLGERNVDKISQLQASVLITCCSTLQANPSILTCYPQQSGAFLPRVTKVLSSRQFILTPRSGINLAQKRKYKYRMRKINKSNCAGSNPSRKLCKSPIIGSLNRPNPLEQVNMTRSLIRPNPLEQVNMTKSLNWPNPLEQVNMIKGDAKMGNGRHNLIPNPVSGSKMDNGCLMYTVNSSNNRDAGFDLGTGCQSSVSHQTATKLLQEYKNDAFRNDCDKSDDCVASDDVGNFRGIRTEPQGFGVPHQNSFLPFAKTEMAMVTGGYNQLQCEQESYLLPRTKVTNESCKGEIKKNGNTNSVDSVIHDWVDCKNKCDGDGVYCGLLDLIGAISTQRGANNSKDTRGVETNVCGYITEKVCADNAAEFMGQVDGYRDCSELIGNTFDKGDSIAYTVLRRCDGMVAGNRLETGDVVELSDSVIQEDLGNCVVADDDGSTEDLIQQEYKSSSLSQEMDEIQPFVEPDNEYQMSDSGDDAGDGSVFESKEDSKDVLVCSEDKKMMPQGLCDCDIHFCETCAVTCDHAPNEKSSRNHEKNAIHNSQLQDSQVCRESVEQTEPQLGIKLGIFTGTEEVNKSKIPDIQEGLQIETFNVIENDSQIFMDYSVRCTNPQASEKNQTFDCNPTKAHDITMLINDQHILDANCNVQVADRSGTCISFNEKLAAVNSGDMKPYHALTSVAGDNLTVAGDKSHCETFCLSLHPSFESKEADFHIMNSGWLTSNSAIDNYASNYVSSCLIDIDGSPKVAWEPSGHLDDSRDKIMAQSEKQISSVPVIDRCNKLNDPSLQMDSDTVLMEYGGAHGIKKLDSLNKDFDVVVTDRKGRSLGQYVQFAADTSTWDGKNLRETTAELARLIEETGSPQLPGQNGSEILLNEEKNSERETIGWNFDDYPKLGRDDIMERGVRNIEEDAVSSHGDVYFVEIQDFFTGDKVYVNAVSGNTVPAEVIADVHRDRCKRDAIHTQLPSPNTDKTCRERTATSDTKMMRLWKQHIQSESLNCKWRGYRDCCTKRAEGSGAVCGLLADWDNPVFPVPDEDVMSVEVSEVPHCKSVARITHSMKFHKNILDSFHVIGQVDRKFIVCRCQSPSSKDASARELLVFVDQHAAHERVRLERLVREMWYSGGRGPSVTRVSPPLKLELSEDQKRMLRAFHMQFTAIGVEFDADGSTVVKAPSCLFTAHPPGSQCTSLNGQLIHVGQDFNDYIDTGIFQELVVGQLEYIKKCGRVTSTVPPTIHAALSSRACHGAIKFGDELTTGQCTDLMNDLRDTRLPFQCAHGRPAMVPVLDLSQLRALYATQGDETRPRLSKLHTQMVASTGLLGDATATCDI